MTKKRPRSNKKKSLRKKKGKVLHVPSLPVPERKRKRKKGRTTGNGVFFKRRRV